MGPEAVPGWGGAAHVAGFGCAEGDGGARRVLKGRVCSTLSLVMKSK